MVGTFHYIEVMLDDDNGVASADERVEGFEQLLDIVEMLASGWLVEYENGRRGFFDTEEIS